MDPDINSTISKDTGSKLIAQDGITRFRTEDHEVEERPESGCPSVLDYGRLP